MKIRSPALRRYIVMATKKSRSSKKSTMTPSNKPSASEAEAGLQGPDVSLTTNNAGETGGLGVPPDLLNGPTTVSDSPIQDQGDGEGNDPPRLWSDVARKPDKQDGDD